MVRLDFMFDVYNIQNSLALHQMRLSPLSQSGDLVMKSVLSFTSTLTQERDTIICLGWWRVLTAVMQILLAMVNLSSCTQMENWRFGLDLRITIKEDPMARETHWVSGPFLTEALSRLM